MKNSNWEHCAVNGLETPQDLVNLIKIRKNIEEKQICFIFIKGVLGLPWESHREYWDEFCIELKKEIPVLFNDFYEKNLLIHKQWDEDKLTMYNHENDIAKLMAVFEFLEDDLSKMGLQIVIEHKQAEEEFFSNFMLRIRAVLMPVNINRKHEQSLESSYRAHNKKAKYKITYFPSTWKAI